MIFALIPLSFSSIPMQLNTGSHWPGFFTVNFYFFQLIYQFLDGLDLVAEHNERNLYFVYRSYLPQLFPPVFWFCSTKVHSWSGNQWRATDEDGNGKPWFVGYTVTNRRLLGVYIKSLIVCTWVLGL